jgi:hypothetical protein
LNKLRVSGKPLAIVVVVGFLFILGTMALKVCCFCLFGCGAINRYLLKISIINKSDFLSFPGLNNAL